MKARNIIVCGISLTTLSLLGSPFGSKIDEKLDKAYESFSTLKVQLDKDSIKSAYVELESVLKEIQTLNNADDYETEGQIINIKKNLKFLKDLRDYVNNLGSEEKLKQWANSNCKFIPIIQKALSRKH